LATRIRKPGKNILDDKIVRFGQGRRRLSGSENSHRAGTGVELQRDAGSPCKEIRNLLVQSPGTVEWRSDLHNRIGYEIHERAFGRWKREPLRTDEGEVGCPNRIGIVLEDDAWVAAVQLAETIV
jgi:hypothetical protein